MALSLEGRPWYYGLGIGVVLAVGLVWLADWQFIEPIEGQIKAAESQIKELDTKIEQGRSAQRKLPQFREEVHRLELELEKLRRILPSTRNTEEIIKKIKSVRLAFSIAIVATAMAAVFAQTPAGKPGGGSTATATAKTAATATSTTGTTATTGTSNVQEALQEILEGPSTPESYRYDPQ